MGQVRLDEGKPANSNAARQTIPSFRYPGHRDGRTSLRPRPKSETMALIGAGIRGMSVHMNSVSRRAQRSHGAGGIIPCWLRPARLCLLFLIQELPIV